MRSVLVTDGDLRASLAVVRSLGRAGYRCFVCSSTGHSLAGSSRYAYRDYSVADAALDQDAFADAIVQLVQGDRIQMVIPMSEASILALLASRERVAARIPFPDIDVFSAVCNKAKVLATASEIGIRIPRQFEIHSPRRWLKGSHEFPLILKPHASVVSTGGATRTKVGVSWVHNEDELDHVLASYPLGAYPLLAQEVIKGPGIGVFVLMHEGRALARFAHRRIREKPPSGGVSVICESEPLDAALFDATCHLLRQFGWTGVAMVEYKLDEDRDEPVLMEINGRFWGSLQLAIDAGVDFPRLLAGIGFGDSVAPIEAFDHVRLRWFWGDVDNLISQWRQSPGWSVRLRALLEWIRAFGTRNRPEVFRLQDPLPFFRETAAWVADVRNG